jgi:transketolase
LECYSLGQSEETAFGHDVQVYADRATAFGWHSIIVDGHNVTELLNAFAQAAAITGKPTAIIAKTYKGRGFPNIEDKLNWHGKALGDVSAAILTHLEKQMSTPTPDRSFTESTLVAPEVDLSKARLSEPPTYTLGDKIATRFAYGTALVKLGRSCDRVVSLDADTKNSTYAEAFMKQFPSRFIECYIAEQNLVGVAIGAACRGRTIPFVSTFAAFFTRAADHLRMAAISQANIKLVGSHCGVSIGEDGPSQMALEDLSLFRSIPGCNVYYPSDAVSTERAIELAAGRHGIDFIRTSRPATSVIYTSETKFEAGKAHVVRQSPKDSVLLIGAGITLQESIRASELLAAEGISARVLDPFTIKPLDVDAIAQNARQVGGLVVVTEDHYPQGGLGEAVGTALSTSATASDHFRFEHLAVRELPRSGQPDELVIKYGLDATAIVAAVHRLLK